MLARRSLLCALVLTSLAASCRLFRPIDPTPDPEPEPMEASVPVAEPRQQAPAPKEVGSLRDRNIAAMLLASSNTDISYARLVPPRAQRDDVKQFAERMLTDHTSLNALLSQLLVRIDLAPEDNIASLELRTESATKRDIMRDLTGFAFDSTYVENELRYHQGYLALLDNVMLPAVRNEELRALLTTIRAAVAGHLAHVEQLWANVMAKR